LLTRSEAYLGAGRIHEATKLAQRALDLSRKHQERGSQAHCLLLLGDIASHRDPPDTGAAEDHYRQAMALAEELGMRPLVAHCHLGLGRLYRQAGSRQQAQERLTTARTMFRDMDMRFWLDKAELEMKELG